MHCQMQRMGGKIAYAQLIFSFVEPPIQLRTETMPHNKQSMRWINQTKSIVNRENITKKVAI